MLGRVFERGALRRVLVAVAGLVGRVFVRGGDRTSLTLRPADERLIRAVAAANARTVVVLIGGSAILTESWRHRVPALVQAWYPGMEGGRALADVLIGRVEPGGRLPFAVPTDAAHLPPFDRHATRVVYDAWWGQRRLDRDGHAPAFPLGFGLGYTTFDVTLVEHTIGPDAGTAVVRVRNAGARAGSTVAQVYAAQTVADDDAAAGPVPQLLGFRRVRLAAGAEETVGVDLDPGPLRQRDPATRTWSWRGGEWSLMAAQCSPSSMSGEAPLRLID